MTFGLDPLQILNSKWAWRDIFKRMSYAPVVAPRGKPTKEILYAQFVMPQFPFQCFTERKLSMDYIRRELQWYLNADESDTRITKHAKLWLDHRNKDGTWSSNYGTYLFFREGLLKAYRVLKTDMYSRRALVTIFNSDDHLAPGIKDIPCTLNISWIIRHRGGTPMAEPLLHQIVTMRSNDLIFGLGNDAPIFSIVHKMMLALLKEDYPNIELGEYVHRADSLHAYEKHWDLVADIGHDRGTWKPAEIPDITSAAEVHKLIDGETKGSKFINWLYEVEL